MTTETEGAPEGVTEDVVLSDDTATEDTTTQTEDLGDDQAASADEGDEGEGEQPKPKRKSPEERIAEVTKARREAEREAAHWRRIAQESAQPKQDQRQAPPADAEPDPSEFQYGETDPGYIKALGAFTARQEFARLSQQRDREVQTRSVEQTWNERQQSFAKEKPDYHEVLDRDWVCSPPMADAIRTSDDGPAVAYHLASNPDEARRIAALNPLAQIREIGRLEARLSKPAVQATPAKTVSDAPAPAPQIRGSGGKFKPAPDTDDFAAFERTYRIG